VWRIVVLGGVCLVVLVAAFLDLYDPHPPGWGLTSAERANVAAGGWKDALEPHESIPIEPNQAAEEIASRLAGKYCGVPETNRLEQHDTDYDYIKFVPACFEIDEPKHRLETSTAAIEVHVGDLPMIEFNGIREHSCRVNAGDQYKDFGLCVRNLLRET
jgi:hypothetical protein